MTTAIQTMSARETDPLGMLEFSAPYLEKKLRRLGLAETESQARELFLEVKKYLALTVLHAGRELPMYSARIDQVWHEFVLFTTEYAAFCSQHAGQFLHHAPLEAPPRPVASSAGKTALTFAEFRAAYEASFGELSPAWFDELALTGATRLCWSSWATPLGVRDEGSRAVLVRQAEQPTVLCRVNARARAALEFISEQRFFLVRELPGLPSDSDRLTLCRPLVSSRILNLAP